MSVSGRIEVTSKLKVGIVHNTAMTIAAPDAIGELKMSLARFFCCGLKRRHVVPNDGDYTDKQEHGKG